MLIHLKSMPAGRSLPSLKARIGVDWNKKFIQVICLTALMGGSTMHAMDKPSEITLHNAARNGEYEFVAQVLANGAAIDAKDDYVGWTPLMCAAKRGHVAICRLLLEKGAAVDAQDEDGWTALTYAAFLHHEAVCQLLINAMLQPILESKAKIVALLGIKKVRQSACLNIINRDTTQLIARQMYEPAALQLRNLFDQINTIPNNKRAPKDGQLALKKRLLAYVRQQLRFETNIAQEANHE